MALELSKRVYDLYLNILELPNDILQKIQTFLGRKKYIFLYVVLSNKDSDESKKLDVTKKKLVNNIHNSITYVRMFEEVLWGHTEIPTSEKFVEILLTDYLHNPLSNKERLLKNFEIMKEMVDYLDTSPNKNGKDIIWKGKTIGTKKRYTK